MEQSLTKTQEESVAVADLSEATTQQTTENTLDATKDKTETTAPDESARSEKEQVNQKINLLYEHCLGFTPGSLSGKRDPSYVYEKFPKDYKDFDYTHEDILQILEEANLLQYLDLLQILKPNKSIGVYFSTEDAAQFFIGKHVEISGKPIPFIRKAKRILRVTINGIHPDLTDEELRAELFGYIELVSSIKHTGRNYNGMVFKDGTRQLYVTSLTQHIPRSLKIGDRCCLAFYRDQSVPQRKPPQIPTIRVTPPSEGSAAQMEWDR